MTERIRIDIDPADATKPVAWLRMRAEANRVAATGIDAAVEDTRRKLADLEREAKGYRDAALGFDEAAELLVDRGFADVEQDQPQLPLGAGRKEQ